MRTSDISDVQVCEAYRRWGVEAEACVHAARTAEVHLMEMTGAPIKVALSAMSRASRHGLVNYGVSLRTGWLEDAGKQLLDINAEAEADFAELLNLPVHFGLVAQGHIPTIERMLAEGRTWSEIGAVIGWMPETAEKHYGWYLERRKASDGGAESDPA